MPEALWEVEYRVREIAAKTAGINVDAIRPDSRLIEDLNLDSLNIVEFVMELEDAFDISIPDGDQTLFFTSGPATIHSVAIAVQRWPESETTRPIPLAQERPTVEEVPFTQSGPAAQANSQTDKYILLGANREGYSEFRRRSDGMRCILVPAGKVLLGDPSSGGRETKISEFLLDAEPVSNTAYARFLNSLGQVPIDVVAEWCGCNFEDQRSSQFPLHRRRGLWEPVKGTERQPIVLVSWFGAAAYSLWANELDWQIYRSENCLPSEAQWEYAAQRHSNPVVGLHAPGTAYELSTLPAFSVSARAGVSPFGAHHMGGNVWQWCRDWFVEDYHEQLGGQLDPVQRKESGIRSERGGSWVGPAELSLRGFAAGDLL